MEVAVLDSEGLPGGSLLSVRCGGVRRQAPVEKVHASALKFPCSIDSCCDPLKIEVLQPVAAARLVLQHREETYQVGLNANAKNGKCHETMRVALHVRSASSSLPPPRAESASTNGRPKVAPPALLRPSSAPLKFQDAAVSAREYLEVHGLLRYIQGLLHAVIQVRPEDPFQFMIQQLSAAQVSGASPVPPEFASAATKQDEADKPDCSTVLETDADTSASASPEATSSERVAHMQQQAGQLQEPLSRPAAAEPPVQAPPLAPPPLPSQAPAPVTLPPAEPPPHLQVSSQLEDSAVGDAMGGAPLLEEASLQEEAPRHHQHASGVAPPDHHNMASGAEQAPREDDPPDYLNVAGRVVNTHREDALPELNMAHRAEQTPREEMSAVSTAAQAEEAQSVEVIAVDMATEAEETNAVRRATQAEEVSAVNRSAEGEALAPVSGPAEVAEVDAVSRPAEAEEANVVNRTAEAEKVNTVSRSAEPEEVDAVSRPAEAENTGTGSSAAQAEEESAVSKPAEAGGVRAASLTAEAEVSAESRPEELEENSAVSKPAKEEEASAASRPAEAEGEVSRQDQAVELSAESRPAEAHTSLQRSRTALNEACAYSTLRAAVANNELQHAINTPGLGQHREGLKRSLLNASASGMLDAALKRILTPEALTPDVLPKSMPAEGSDDLSQPPELPQPPLEAPPAPPGSEQPPPLPQLPQEAPPAPKDAPPQLPIEQPKASEAEAQRTRRRRRALMNSAFVFIKPHAVNDHVCNLVKEALMVNDIVIRREGAITSEEFDIGMLIDRHYYSVASKASLLTPGQLNVPKDVFKSKFGVDWDEALKSGRALNAKDACEAMGLDASEIAAKWSDAKKANKLIHFGGGCYCAQLEAAEKGTYFVINGFFLALRQKYVTQGAAIHYFVVEWDSKRLTWEEFRAKVIGASDPTKAPRSSLRGTLFASWEEWGLLAEPDLGDNGVHASASPFEAFAERLNWLGQIAEKDPFGQALLRSGIPLERLQEWTKDPQVMQDVSLFQVLRNMDADECLDKCRRIAGVSSSSKPASDCKNYSSGKPASEKYASSGNPAAERYSSSKPVHESFSSSKPAVETVPAASQPTADASPPAVDQGPSHQDATQAMLAAHVASSPTQPAEAFAQPMEASSARSEALVELRGIHDAIRDLRNENVSLKQQVDSMASQMSRLECKILSENLEGNALA